MNKLGLKEPGFENRRTFSRKAREPQKLSRFQKFALVNVSQSRTDKQASKRAWNSQTSVATAMLIIVSKIEKSFQVSSEFKLNEGMTLSSNFRLLFRIRNRFFMSQSLLIISRQAQTTLLLFIGLERRLLVNLYRISMQEGTLLVWRKTLYWLVCRKAPH